MIDKDIAIVGSGNVATHLACALRGRVAYVLSRNIDHARNLAETIGADASSDFGILRTHKVEVVIVSVADHALATVAEAIGSLDYEPLVVHTSGTLPKEVLEAVSPRTGILYPLQTFTKGVDVDMSRVPFFNEATRDSDLALIDNIARCISQSVYHADGSRRQVLHIAGVYTSNFTNILLESVERVLGSAGYGLDVVQPLLEATVGKAFAVGPHTAQTGPARRGDIEVVKKHLSVLPDDMKPVYTVLTQAIFKSHNIPYDEPYQL